MSIQVRDLITRLQEIPDQTAQVFIAIRDVDMAVELPIESSEIRPWNPAKVHIVFDTGVALSNHIVELHPLYKKLQDDKDATEEENDILKRDLQSEKENAGKLRDALASIKREVDSVID